MTADEALTQPLLEPWPLRAPGRTLPARLAALLDAVAKGADGYEAALDGEGTTVIPSRRHPTRAHARAVILIILANVVIHLLSRHPAVQEPLLSLGVVPARYLFPDWAAVVGFPATGVLPFFSYMFLHSGWWHVIMNMWMLWIFADNIEDVMGPGRSGLLPASAAWPPLLCICFST
jgi:membrane associated rhomboid family serine protease